MVYGADLSYKVILPIYYINVIINVISKDGDEKSWKAGMKLFRKISHIRSR